MFKKIYKWGTPWNSAKNLMKPSSSSASDGPPDRGRARHGLLRFYTKGAAKPSAAFFEPQQLQAQGSEAPMLCRKTW